LQSLALSTHATTIKPGAALPPLTRGRRPKRYWRVWRADGESKKAGTITGVFVLYVHWRILILLLIIFIFLISQYAYHPGRRSRLTSSIPQSSRTSLILPAKRTTAASVLLYSPRYSRRPIPIREDITNTSRHVSHLPIATRGLLRLLYILDWST
jgi:hypothetical protein